jgi:hypothetical protein
MLQEQLGQTDGCAVDLVKPSVVDAIAIIRRHGHGLHHGESRLGAAQAMGEGWFSRTAAGQLMEGMEKNLVLQNVRGEVVAALVEAALDPSVAAQMLGHHQTSAQEMVRFLPVDVGLVNALAYQHFHLLHEDIHDELVEILGHIQLGLLFPQPGQIVGVGEHEEEVGQVYLGPDVDAQIVQNDDAHMLAGLEDDLAGPVHVYVQHLPKSGMQLLSLLRRDPLNRLLFIFLQMDSVDITHGSTAAY